MMRIVEIIRTVMAAIAIVVIMTAGTCVVLHLEPAIVMSGSMEPVIHTGSLLLVDRDKAGTVTIGDTIAFRNGDADIAHRIVDVSSGGFITKGDANDSVDPWVVDTAKVRGKVVATIPLLGYVVKLMASTTGIVILACLIICMGLSSLLEPAGGESGENKMTSAS